MEQNRNSIAPEAATDEPASPCSTLTDFDPVPLRYRTDGLTPAKQREYVEALADTGVARVAAERIGMSEQAVNRVRRRADARAFDLACEAAQRFGARRLRSIAYERAIEGTVKRHYFHGELKNEEVVYDNRLLIYLLGKADKWLEPPAQAEVVADDWEAWADAIEQGLPEPDGEPDEIRFDGSEVWDSADGRRWTSFPPPDDFDGDENGVLGSHRYERTLTAGEEAWIDYVDAQLLENDIACAAQRRDAYFGDSFEPACDDSEEPVFSPREAELSETSAPSEPESRREEKES